MTPERDPQFSLPMNSKAAELLRGLNRWEFWTLVALARHEVRQKWVGRIVVRHLDGDLAKIGSRGYFGHPDRPLQGVVPGLSGWCYDFHGKGCLLSERSKGLKIDVDFGREGECDLIDTFFYSYFLKSLKRPALPEAQLRGRDPEWHPWKIDLNVLQQLGAVEGEGTGDKAIQLSPEARRAGREARRFVRRLEGLIRSGETGAAADLAFLWGDPVLARNLDQGRNEFADAADDLIAQRIENLRRALEQSEEPKFALQGVANLDRRDSLDLVTEILRHAGSDSASLMGDALQIASFWGERALTPLVISVLAGWEGEHSSCAVRDCLCFLLRVHDPNSLPREEIASILEAKAGGDFGVCEGKVAGLAFLIDRSVGSALLARALRSEIPFCVMDAVASLAFIGNEPGAEDLLYAALEERKDYRLGTYLVTGLRAIGARDVDSRAADWLVACATPEVKGHQVEFDGKTLETYSLDQLAAMNAAEEMTGWIRLFAEQNAWMREWL